MRLWTFEPLLIAALQARNGVTVRSFRDADVGLLYGVEIVSTSGVRALLHLVSAGDPPLAEPAPEHVANLARLEGLRQPSTAPSVDPAMAGVERFVRSAIETAALDGVVLVQTLRERRKGCTAYGVYVLFDDGAEVFGTLVAG